jgi:hypothetical protein
VRKLLVLLGVVVATVGVIAGPAPAAPPTCGAVITRSTRLTADLLGCPGDGLVIAASRLTIDLGGHTLGAAPGNAGIGIRTTGQVDVKIINGSIAGFDTGITVTDSLRVTVREVAVTGPETGIRFDGAVHSYIRSSSVVTDILLIELIDSDTNEISTTVGLGDADNHASVRLKEGSDGNVIRDSSFRRSNGPNVVLLDSDDNRIEDSDLGGSNTVGVQLIRSDRNRVRRNLTDSEAESVNVSSSTGNQVNDNDGGDSSLFVVESTDTLVRGNVAGFLAVRRSAGTTVIGNVLLDDHRDDGLIVDPLSTGTRLIRNRSTGFVDDGIDVDAVGTYLEGNRANDNGDLGIEAVPGVVDGGGNRASGNGNGLQCTGVVCTP